MGFIIHKNETVGNKHLEATALIIRETTVAHLISFYFLIIVFFLLYLFVKMYFETGVFQSAA